MIKFIILVVLVQSENVLYSKARNLFKQIDQNRNTELDINEITIWLEKIALADRKRQTRQIVRVML